MRSSSSWWEGGAAPRDGALSSRAPGCRVASTLGVRSVYDHRVIPRAELPRPLRPFVDDEGRIQQWPSRQKVQRMAAALLAMRFEPGRDYSETEVNLLLMDGHTFADWALLRRELYDWRFLDRESDGSRYWVRGEAAERIARELPGPASS